MKAYIVLNLNPAVGQRVEYAVFRVKGKARTVEWCHPEAGCGRDIPLRQFFVRRAWHSIPRRCKQHSHAPQKSCNPLYSELTKKVKVMWSKKILRITALN